MIFFKLNLCITIFNPKKYCLWKNHNHRPVWSSVWVCASQLSFKLYVYLASVLLRDRKRRPTDQKNVKKIPRARPCILRFEVHCRYSFYVIHLPYIRCVDVMEPMFTYVGGTNLCRRNEQTGGFSIHMEHNRNDKKRKLSFVWQNITLIGKGKSEELEL